MIWLIIWLSSLLAISLVFNYILYLENKEYLSRLKLVDQLQSEAIYNKWNYASIKKKINSKKKVVSKSKVL